MSFVKTTILLLTLTVMTGVSALATPVTIKFSSIESHGSLKRKASDYFKRLVEQRTNRRILVSVILDGPSSDQQLIDALKANSIQMAAPEISELYSIDPQLRLFDLPFIFNDVEHLHRVIDTEVGTMLLESASQDGLVALSFWDNGFRQLTANRALIRPQQVEGLRIQIKESEVLKEQLERLGAETQTISQGLLYTALNDKKIEGQESTLASIYSQKLYQVQSNLILSHHQYQGYLVMTNSRFWSQLPEDLKVIVKGAIKDAAEYTRDMAEQINNEALTKIAATTAMKIDNLSQEEKALWFEELKKIYPDPYRKIGDKLIQKARQQQIR